METLSNSFKYNNNFSRKLAIFCSDERFVEANLAFLKNSLKIKRCDLMVLPGGPVFIVNDESNLLERLRILIKAHKIKKIILISHADCSYYKISFGNSSEEKILKKQLDDIQKAIQKLNQLFADILVYGFHSQIGNSKIINFIRV